MSDDTICYGDSITLTGGGSGGAGNYIYFWNNNIGLTDPAIVSPLQETSYEVTAIDQNGCLGTTEEVIIYVQSMFQQDLGVFANSPICPGTSTYVYASLNGTNTGPVTFSWSPNLGTTAGAYQLFPTTPTTYVATVTNACGVVITDSVSVEFKPLPTVNYFEDLSVGCQPLEVSFTDSSLSNTVGDTIRYWNWDFGDGGTSTDQNPTYIYEDDGIFDVTLTVTTNAGCVNDSTQSNLITIHPKPVAEFETSSADYSSFEMEVEFINLSTGAVDYYWEFGDGGTSLDFEPTHLYSEEGVNLITLIVTSDQGCKDTTELELLINTENILFVPNTFTPDGDGVNDFFFSTGSGIDEDNFQLWIYDRWGELIYFTHRYLDKWDGTVKGRPTQEGTYVWIIKTTDVAGRFIQLEGHVNLLR